MQPLHAQDLCQTPKLMIMHVHANFMLDSCMVRLTMAVQAHKAPWMWWSFLRTSWSCLRATLACSGPFPGTAAHDHAKYASFMLKTYMLR